MGHRRKARESAVQILYQMEMKNCEPKPIFSLFWQQQEEPSEFRGFATELVEGIYRNRIEIDQLIEKHSIHWKINRMAVVDRNILRLGTYELLYLHDVPTSVVLNEAIDIAKKFGTQDSGSFINGILDNIAKAVRK